MKLLSVAFVLAALFLVSCGAPEPAPERFSPEPPSASGGVSSQEEAPLSPAGPERKPLSQAKELPVSSEPVRLNPDVWEIPENPHYQGKPYQEVVWWVHGRILRITTAANYQAEELPPPSPPPLDLDIETIDTAEALTRQYLCDEFGDLLCPFDFCYIFFRENYISLTNLQETFLIDYDGNEADALRFPTSKAHSMDLLPNGSYLGYIGQVMITYDPEGNELARDTTGYQVELPNGAVLDTNLICYSLLNVHFLPYLRNHPDPAVEEKINAALSDFFSNGNYFLNQRGEMTGVSQLTFSADCSGDILHVEYNEFIRRFRVFSGDWRIAHFHFDLNTGESYYFSDLFADEEAARRVIYEKASAEYAVKNDYQPMKDLDHYFTPDSFFIQNGYVRYETKWIFSHSKTGVPVEIPLEEFGESLNRDGGFYRALTQS